VRQLATIRKIDDIRPIENACAIEKVRIGGWWCVSKKGEFKAGDPCVYFEIDSLLPATQPAFAFLAARSREVTIEIEDGTASGYRLRTVRLRGQISQGLALPLDALGIESTTAIDTDVSERIGVHKWEPPISKQMAAQAFGPFPSFIPKTDEERVQNLSDVVTRNAGNIFYVTEKLDGCSVTMYRTEERFGVCSRNWDLLEGNLYWNAARAAYVEDRLPVGYAIQAEIIGESIQGNPLKRKGQNLYVFNVYSIGDGRFLNFDEMVKFCDERSWMTVPIVKLVLELPSDIGEIVAMADGKSLLAPLCDREGLVFRPLIETREEIRGGMSRLSFKAISNNYLLKEK
jgi:RNA ligase (TIGR02306 family)